jgi:pimeloyl-ACP methyl ester carboxylesterase
MRRGTRILLSVLALLSAAFTEAPLTQTATPANLAGTLTLPDAPHPPGVLIIPGGTDRDGNRPGQHNDSLKLLAQGLADCGIASLRIDPRGYGDSTQAVPWDLDSFTTDITEADARTWLGLLGRHAGPLAALGVGDGALTALRIDAPRLVLLEAASRSPGEVLRQRLATLGLSGQARARMASAIDDLEAGRSTDDVPPAMGQILRFGQTWLISLFHIDPLAELRRTRAPTLVIDGTTDLELQPQDGARLAAARPGIIRTTLPFMNHALRVAPADFGINLATYEHRELKLHPQLLPALCQFLRK